MNKIKQSFYLKHCHSYDWKIYETLLRYFDKTDDFPSSKMYVKVEFTLSVSTCILALVRLGQVDLDLVELQRGYLEWVKP